MTTALYVDLDGTLVKTDTLHESLLKLVKENPNLALRSPLWLLKGKAGFKEEVARHVQIDPSALPFNEGLLAYLESESAAGATLVLATAAHQSIAQAVADHTGLFERVQATDGTANLSGSAKLDAIRRETDDFLYAGNASEDLHVWRAARGAIVVGSKMIKEKASQVTEVTRWFAPERSRTKLIMKSLRVHQWTKNVLVFLPLFLAQQGQNLDKLALAFWSFATFSLVASSVYVTNDLLDLESDRLHPEKRKRPLASGDLPISWGVGLALGTMAIGFSVAGIVSAKLLVALLGYFIITTLYSFRLKRIPIVDGFTLATLYSWRIMTGGKLTAVPITIWLIAFCMFFFLSLAFAKRATELLTMKELHRDKASGRGYRVEDLGTIRLLGVGSGVASIVILTMYMNHPGVQVLYKTPSYLLGSAIAIFYWICRVWIKTDRHEMHSDPIVFAVKDRVSYGVLLVAVLFAALAKFF